MAIYVRDSVYTIFSVSKGGALGNSKGWFYYPSAHSPRAAYGVGIMDGTDYTYSTGSTVSNYKYWIVHCQDRTNLLYSFQPWTIRNSDKTTTTRCLCVYGATTDTTSVSNGTLVDCRSNHSEGYNTCKWKITGSTSVAYFQNNQTSSYIQHTSTLYNEDEISTRTSTNNYCRWLMTESAADKTVTYSVTFNGNGGTWEGVGGSGDTTWTFNAYYGRTTNMARTAPVRTGYTLTGMWTAASGGTRIFDKSNNLVIPRSVTPAGTAYCTVPYASYSNGGNTYTLASWRYLADATFYAQWTENSYNITYNLGGGSFSRAYNSTADDGNYTYIWNPTVMPYTNSAYTVNSGKSRNGFFRVEQPTRPGYTFKGWTITGMDSTTHHYWIGSQQSSTATSWDTSTWSNLSPAMRYLRATAGTVTFTAQWELNTNAWVNVEGTWKHGKVWVKVGDTWKLANRFGINASGTWKDGI